MSAFFSFLVITLAVLMLINLYRVVRGPTAFDRMLGLNGISTGYALLNLVGALAIAKFLEERGAAKR